MEKIISKNIDTKFDIDSFVKESVAVELNDYEIDTDSIVFKEPLEAFQYMVENSLNKA